MTRAPDNFDHVPVSIASREIHARVRLRRIGAEDLVHDTLIFDEFPPIVRAEKA